MKEETTITFLASECGEFHGMGECIECTSLKEAFRHYQRFCKRSPQMVPSLEFSLHHAMAAYNIFPYFQPMTEYSFMLGASASVLFFDSLQQMLVVFQAIGELIPC